jgi:hypothetical protein
MVDKSSVAKKSETKLGTDEGAIRPKKNYPFCLPGCMPMMDDVTQEPRLPEARPETPHGKTPKKRL